MKKKNMLLFFAAEIMVTKQNKKYPIRSMWVIKEQVFAAYKMSGEVFFFTNGKVCLFFENI